MEIFIAFIFGVILGLMAFLVVPTINIFTSGTFFVVLGAIATACALLYTITKDHRDQKKAVTALKVSLENELITNIQNLFSGEVERPSLFDAIKLLRRKYSEQIVDHDVFLSIQRLYLDLEYYQTFVSKVYLKSHIVNSPEAVAQKQMSIINTFLKFFGENEWPIQNHEASRAAAIATKDEKIEVWKTKVHKLIEKMLQ